MRTAALVLIALVAAVVVVALSFVMAVPSAQDPGAPPQFLHIQTMDGGDGQPVNLTLPFGAVGALLAMAPGAIAENGNIRLGEGQHLPVDTLRDLWAQVQSTSGPVTVEHQGTVIRVEQTGERVQVHFERNGEATQAELPAAVLDAALGAADGGLDIQGAVQALEASPGSEIRVSGDGRQMRVWIDTEAGQ